jgi:uncharacterized radical SAM protein YgiQ
MATLVHPAIPPDWRVPGTVPDPAAAGRALPMSRREMETRGWAECDVIVISGDAYIDHPSFGAALIGRWLEWLGYRVGIIAQPDPRAVESFKVLGRPRLFWGITAGNVDSELARLTVMRKIRHDDAYTPGGKAGRRPPNATIVYTAAARQAFKGVPVVLGGVEASLRRFAYYDFWTDKVRRSILFDAKADLLVYGMAERALAEVARRLRDGGDGHGIAGTAGIRKAAELPAGTLRLPSYEEVAKTDEAGRRAFAGMTRTIYLNHGAFSDTVLSQTHGDRELVVYPPVQPPTEAELDLVYALPFTRRPHPAYGAAKIPAYEMIKDSVTTHRGCYAGCAFCAIAMHQGRAVTSRSKASVLDELGRLTRDPAFHGTVSDLGGPTANMYGTGCRQGRSGCPERNCLVPQPCPQLDMSHARVLDLMRAARRVPGVKHAFVTSGVRHDLALAGGGREYVQELVDHHVSGLLKIAPEHVSDGVLSVMRKPGRRVYETFTALYRACLGQAQKPYALVEYFISGHPGCTLGDMVELACYLHGRGLQPEQVQDFYPAPLTLAAAMFHTGLDPLTLQPVPVAKTDREKALQRALLLCHQPAFQDKAREALGEAGREDLIGHGRQCLVPPARPGQRRGGH